MREVRKKLGICWRKK